MVAREGFVICKSERGFRGGCKTSNRKKKRSRFVVADGEIGMK